MNFKRRASRRATLLFPDAAGPSIAITRYRSFVCIRNTCATSAVFRGTRAEASARLLFHRRGRNKRANHRRARANAPRADEFVQVFFEDGIGFANAIGVLNIGFAIVEKSRDR